MLSILSFPSFPIAFILLVFVWLAASNEVISEDTFIDKISVDKIRSLSELLSGSPHWQGYDGDYAGQKYALYMKARLEEYLPNADFVSVKVVDFTMNVPYLKSCEISYGTGGQTKALDLTENNEKDLPFMAFSGSGEVSGEWIDGGYGESFDDKVKGKIVLAKYGKVSPWIKVNLAQKNGALGVLLYHDAADDGSKKGKTFPEGQYRPDNSVQRDTVQFLGQCAGDPAQPSCGNATPSIPVFPISYSSAQQILAAKATVTVKLSMASKPATLYNVVATINSPKMIDETVVIGNHRDSWEIGAADPVSGTVVFLEIARVIGDLLKTTSWKPNLNIIFGSWDGGVFGYSGATDWVEKINYGNVAAYVNVRKAFKGDSFTIAGSPSLHDFAKDITQYVKFPGTDDSLKKHCAHEALDILGADSDYVPFVNRKGIPSIDAHFHYDVTPIYGSAYDTLEWMQQYGDPDYSFHKATAQYLGLFAFKLASAEVLPHNYTFYVETLFQELQMLSENLKTFGATDDKNITKELEPLYTELGLLREQIRLLEDEWASLSKDSTRGHRLGDKLLGSEQCLDAGCEGASVHVNLPHTKWYKNVLYGPIDDQDDFVAFPGIVQAYHMNDWDLTINQIKEVKIHITTAREKLHDAAQPKMEVIAAPSVSTVVIMGFAIVFLLGSVYVIRRYRKKDVSVRNHKKYGRVFDGDGDSSKSGRGEEDIEMNNRGGQEEEEQTNTDK